MASAYHNKLMVDTNSGAKLNPTVESCATGAEALLNEHSEVNIFCSPRMKWREPSGSDVSRNFGLIAWGAI
jgi:hypothetical protein